ncbi:MAG: hypothetical protein KGM47_18500 [Acidobacteriota bacterium]|nr:hypothetical protein [Acidobacteriota bacterium]
MKPLLRIFPAAALGVILLALPLSSRSQNAGTNGFPQQPQSIQQPRQGLGNSQTIPNSQTLPQASLAPFGKLSRRQKDALVKANLKATQHDVDKLSKLVQALDQEMKKASPDILSVSIVEQANKIEKLAKKIKNETKSY